MNKNNRQKLILSAALLIAATASAFAQGNGIAGINEATSMVSSYFDIGAVAAESLPDVSGMTFDNALSRKERISRFLYRESECHDP